MRSSGVACPPPAATSQPAPSSATPNEEAPKPGSAITRFWSRRRFRILDAIGLTLWAYFFLKIFVADVDRALFSAVAPSAVGLLDYRLVFYLLVLAVIAIFLRRSWW